MRFVLICLLLTLSRCTTPSSKTTSSEWIGLKGLSRSDCEPWPMAEKDLDIESVFPTNGDGNHFGFVGSVKQRNSSIQNVYIPVDSAFKLNTNEAKILPVPQSSRILAAGQTKKNSFIIIASRNADRSTIEVRNVANNEILGKSQFVLDGDISATDISADKNTLWLTLRSGDYSSQFIQINLDHPKLKIDKLPFTSEIRGAQLIADIKSHQAYLVEPATAANGLNFKIRPVKEKTNALGSAIDLKIEAKGGVESWALAAAEGGFYAGAVLGDSMVGQGTLFQGHASIEGSEAKWSWQNKEPLPDLHVSEPVFAQNPKKTIMTIMKWLDSEATMGISEYTHLKAFKKQDSGVHPKGSVVMNSYIQPNGDLGAIVRQKNQDTWRYSICKSKLLPGS